MAVDFLEQGKQAAEVVAAELAGFLAEARATVDIAIYDLVLAGTAHDTFRAAIAGLLDRGIRPRVAYNKEQRSQPGGGPPPAGIVVPPDVLAGCDVVAIPGVPDLMHHKYVIRDADTVWTGSTNWTNDSWTLEENVIVRIESATVAAAFASDFAELWAKRAVYPTGHYRPLWLDLAPGMQGRVYFTPGRAAKLVTEISQRLKTASRRIRICSPVLTDGPILGTLAEIVREGRDLDAKGIYDATQMAEVRQQWSQNSLAAWKLHVLDQILGGIPFSGKVSTPWARSSVHDYMHAKFVVADDYVFVGSYNLSHSGESNAENVVEFLNADLADRFTAYADRIIARYPAVSLLNKEP